MPKRKTYKLLSIDASTTKTGWALWEIAHEDGHGRAYWDDGRLIDHGILTAKEKDADARVDDMGAQIISLVKEKRPAAVATEYPYGQKGTRVLRLLTEIVGIIRGAAIQTGADFAEYLPDQWRALTRREGEPSRPKGRDAVKAWSVKKASLYTTDALCDDESDAILIGVAYMNEQKSNDGRKEP